jgi:hypothetical protein
MILGNHELSQWTQQTIGKGNDELNALFREGVTTAYGSHAEAVYAAYLDLFSAVPLAVRTVNRIFISHSLPSLARLEKFDAALLEQDAHPVAELKPGGSVHALVWGRDVRADTTRGFLQKVDADLLITGHIPCERGFETPNDRQLILDCLGSPAAYCLFPADRALSQQELVRCVAIL